MSAGTCASLCWALLFVSVSAGQETITAEPGQNIILPCRAPNTNQIRAVVWAKPDLEDEHVYLYRDGRFDPEEQNPVYKNRVELQDRQMKDGDVSLTLKDVTVNDTGTYECRVVQGPREPLKISNITLSVAPPPGPGGSAGLIVAVSVCAVLLVAAVAAGLLKHRHLEKHSSRD